jgi:hypothetical protein
MGGSGHNIGIELTITENKNLTGYRLGTGGKTICHLGFKLSSRLHQHHTCKRVLIYLAKIK